MFSQSPMENRGYATDLEDHDSRHITGGDDEVDGDKLDIDYTPTYSTPALTPAEASHIDNLTHQIPTSTCTFYHNFIWMTIFFF